MADMLLHLALAIAAAFTGAALYVNLVEHPARMTLDPRAALAEWQPAYKRGAAMQAPLALLGFLLAAAAVFMDTRLPSVLGALFIIGPWPWTYFVMMKLNTEMLAIAPESADASIREKLAQWNKLHTMRTALGVAATLSLFWAVVDL